MNIFRSRTTAILGIVMFSAAVPFAQSQSTWNSLHFGMSRPEIEQALKAKGGYTIRETDPGVFSLNEPYHVELPDLTLALTFSPKLTISSKGLQQVDLRFDTKATLLDEKAALKRDGDITVVADVVSESMKKALTGKYGAAIEMKGACDDVSIELLLASKRLDCKQSWRTDGQLITVAWWWDKADSSFIYLVSYQAATLDL